MPWLPHYIDEVDAALLCEHLNSDPEIAFIVANGPGRWIAERSLQAVGDGRHCLWHVPSGPLPLLAPGGAPSSIVEDAWQGWSELRAGADPSLPYFGAGHPGVVWWNVKTRSRRGPGIGLSGFEWIGNHYRIIGSSADAATERWWAKLRRLMRKVKASRIPRAGPVDGAGPEIWAWPSALAKISAGAARDDNP
jgi:hypothetical protein